MFKLKRKDLFAMIHNGDFFLEGPSEINVNFGPEASELRALVAEFNNIQNDWFLKIDLEETNLAKWWFRFKPLNREAFLFYRSKKIERLDEIYKNHTQACRAAHTLYSFEKEIVESVKDLELLAKYTKAPEIIEGDPKATNTNMCKWCDGVSPVFIKLSVPRKLSVLTILYGKYLGEDPLDFSDNSKIIDLVITKGGIK